MVEPDFRFGGKVERLKQRGGPGDLVGEAAEHPDGCYLQRDKVGPGDLFEESPLPSFSLSPNDRMVAAIADEDAAFVAGLAGFRSNFGGAE